MEKSQTLIIKSGGTYSNHCDLGLSILSDTISELRHPCKSNERKIQGENLKCSKTSSSTFNLMVHFEWRLFFGAFARESCKKSKTVSFGVFVRSPHVKNSQSSKLFAKNNTGDF